MMFSFAFISYFLDYGYLFGQFAALGGLIALAFLAAAQLRQIISDQRSFKSEMTDKIKEISVRIGLNQLDCQNMKSELTSYKREFLAQFENFQTQIEKIKAMKMIPPPPLTSSNPDSYNTYRGMVNESVQLAVKEKIDEFRNEVFETINELTQTVKTYASTI
jgi:hypothetical protein